MTTRYWKSFLWERLQKNIQQQGLSSAYMSLATIAVPSDGLPSPRVRTVVFRSFAGEHHTDALGWTSECLVVSTDRRSQKWQELALNPHYEACWYMNGTGEQFRLRGILHTYPSDLPMPLVESSGPARTPTPTMKLGNQAFLRRQQGQHFDWEAERQRHFGLLDDGLRATFCTDEQLTTLPITGLDDKGWYVSPAQAALDAAYENFALLVLTVKEMDYCSLAGDHELFTAKI
ncbi:hypothetical protein [Absidia glauca]|uniref:Pyridoxamine 5'-phosphate oxidase Alr4036 family FMN-binding domain-containing protein n=1 Tax=Absidia glauca TaxID=4829 RepID=A0A170ANP3_ABSGL|nr:hypothetical protein [Absidia glauca]